MSTNKGDVVAGPASMPGTASTPRGLASASGFTEPARTGGAPDGVPRPVLLDDAIPMDSRLGIDERLWNWHRDADPFGPVPATWYEASLAPWVRFAPLADDRVCDVVVVGGGLLGMSSALHLAEAGLDVVLLEKDQIGSGASGRNGGQLTPGLARWEAETMIDVLPLEEARRLWRFASVEAMALLDDIAARHDIVCDRRRGHITAAVHPGHTGALVQSADARRLLGDHAVRVVGRFELQDMLRSEAYHGAAIDALGGQIHALALLRGMACAFAGAGGCIHEQTAVSEIDEDAQETRVITEAGVVRARRAVVLAVHYATGDFLPDGNTTVPFHTYVAVSAPLPVPVAALIPAGFPVYDTQLQIDYYRAVRGNRLLFGGQGTGNSWPTEEVNRYLLDRITTVFPQLADAALEYSWSGISDITLNGATDARKREGAVPHYLVHGWSGHGVAQTVRIGKAISDDITGRNQDFAMLTAIEHDIIPFGNYLAPVAIPLVKGALSLRNLFNPAGMVSF